MHGPQVTKQMKPKKPRPQTNADAFIAAAKSIEADEDEKRWEARLKAVVKPAKPKKKGAAK